MKLFIFGASGKTGVELAILASQAGYSITACGIYKNPKSEALNHPYGIIRHKNSTCK